MTDRGMSFAPQRVVVLLTDMEGSTRLWQENAAVMPVVLMAHHRAVAEIVAGHGGRLPPDQGEGDARLAVFTGDGAEAAAVRTALALQGEFAGLELPNGIRLRVRMAVDVGEVVEFEGNVFGTVVNRCARLRGLGHGGQVLVSADVAMAFGDGTEVSLADLGQHSLRDVVEPLRVFQADPVGTRSSFPPLVGVLAAPVVLPEADGPMVGREDALSSVTGLVRQRKLVTLTGTGGSGKTTLATEAARQLVPDFPGGVYFVDLVPVADVADVGRVIATVMGVVEKDDDPWTAITGEFSATKPLVILDNCEDLPELADVLARDAEGALRHVHVLATSRQPLGAEHEVVVPVPPLATPQTETSTRQALEASPAGLLLLTRALEARPGLVVDEETAGHLGDLACRLDGIPLALELAAARLKMQSVASLRASLEDSLAGLDDVTNRHPQRHRTLVDTLAWSVEHLDAESRELLTVLAAFVASPDLTAIAGVAGRTESDVLAPLSRLLEASLARAVELDDGVPRFTLLVPVREHVREATPVDGKADLETRHAQYHLSWAREGSQTRHDTQCDHEWVVEVGVVRGDALQALDHLRRTSPRDGVELSVHLCALWFEHGEWLRGHDELSRSANITTDDNDDPFVILAGLFDWWGSAHRDEAVLPRLRAAAERNGDPRLVAFVTFLQAVSAKFRGDFATARDEFAVVDQLTVPLEAAESAGARPFSGMSRISLIRSLLLPNEVDMLTYTHRAEAVRKAAQALDECRGPSDPAYRAAAVTLAELLVESGDVDAAEATLRLTEPLFAAANSSDEFVRAWIYLLRDDWDEALAALEPQQGPTTAFLSGRNASLTFDIHLLRGELRLAAQALQDMEGLYPSRWWTLPAARAARLAVAEGRPDDAAAWLERVAPLVSVGDASPGTLTFLLTHAMLTDGHARRAWLQAYDDRVAATGVLPWPRDAADRTALAADT